MDGTTGLVTWTALFVGTHFLMSHPLRAKLVAGLGTNGFSIVYSLISLATFIVMLRAYRAVPDAAPYWGAGDGLWWVATVLVLLGSILFVGSFTRNPAMPSPGAEAAAMAAAQGVFCITRHPMMWGFALWAFSHMLISPQPKLIILGTGILFLALVGSAAQDRKKAVLMGDSWKDWSARTSYFPFGNQLAGAAPWGRAWPGRTSVLLGTLVWLLATYGHGWFGIYGAGIWRWVWR